MLFTVYIALVILLAVVDRYLKRESLDLRYEYKNRNEELSKKDKAEIA